MKEVIIISGKGGTGKTSLTSVLAELAEDVVLADCDVDAANLEILLNPEILKTHAFISGVEAKLDESLCTACGACLNLCRFDAIKQKEDGSIFIDETSCEGCKTCATFCPKGAISMQPRACGVWMESETPYGPLIHAALHSAAENSGKLVSTVRAAARKKAEEEKKELILVDGPPGIGCPVIASITGADLLVILCEPTLSGLHDMKRALELAKHFKVPATLCLNKWDLHSDMATSIEVFAREENIPFLGKISYNKEIARALSERKNALAAGEKTAQEFHALWKNLKNHLVSTKGKEK